MSITLSRKRKYLLDLDWRKSLYEDKEANSISDSL